MSTLEDHGVLRRCLTCRYLITRVEQTTECRRRAPTGDEYPQKWPRVATYDWCGEWEPIPKKPKEHCLDEAKVKL